MLKRLQSPEDVLKFALAASVFSLAAAFAAQYGMGLKPCELCITQRVPYGLIIALALIGIRFKKVQRTMIMLSAWAFFVGASIAAYHASVEKHWIAGPTSCTNTNAGTTKTIDDFLKQINDAPIVACDQPQWEFHGITMAVLNAFWSMGLGIITARGFRRKGHAHA